MHGSASQSNRSGCKGPQTFVCSCSSEREHSWLPCPAAPPSPAYAAASLLAQRVGHRLVQQAVGGGAQCRHNGQQRVHLGVSEAWMQQRCQLRPA